jgi:hypothetical protein
VRLEIFSQKIGSAGRASKDEQLGFALPRVSLLIRLRAKGAANPSNLPIFRSSCEKIWVRAGLTTLVTVT